MKWRTEDGGWSPYLAGALVGLLAVASAWATTTVMGKTGFLGASTTFVRAAGLLERSVAAEHVARNAYDSKEQVNVDWQFMLVLGIFAGALVASVSDRSFSLAECYPALKNSVLAWKDFGKIGLPELLGVSPWIIIPLFWAGTIALFVGFEKRRL